MTDHNFTKIRRYLVAPDNSSAWPLADELFLLLEAYDSRDTETRAGLERVIADARAALAELDERPAPRDAKP